MEDEIAGGDVVESGRSRRFRWPDWRPNRGAELLAVAALVVGVAAGYAGGASRPGGGAARPQPTVTVTASPSVPAPATSFSFAGSPALFQDTYACSVQTGHELQLGIQLTNQSAQPVTLTTASAVLPLGGLKLVTWQWGTCGALSSGLSQGNEVSTLLPGGSTWLTATFKVQLTCPGPLPVLFKVGYQVRGHSATASLPGFPDLGQVPYSGCSSSAGGNVGIATVQS